MSQAAKKPAKPAKKSAKKVTTATSGDVIVVGSKVREFVRSMGLRADGDLIAAASDHLKAVLRNAATRARAGGRQTIRPADL